MLTTKSTKSKVGSKISLMLSLVFVFCSFSQTTFSANRPKTSKNISTYNVHQTMLRVKDREIVGADNQPFILKGMGFGGWMVQEGYMFGIPGNGTQYSIKERIAALTDEEFCKQFYDKWLTNFITKADVDSIAAWGFNSIRLPMHYNLYTLPIEQESDSTKNTWLTKGFELTDSLVSWCKAANLYLIPDLHAAPGGQGKDYNISDGNPNLPSLWESEANKLKTIAFWRKFAERYKNETVIAGYDLLNEPNWTFEGKHPNGTDDKINAPLWDLYKRITKAIREVDTNHILFIEGNGWANNFNGFPGKWDDNSALSFHKYWNSTKPSSLNNFLALSKKYNMPLWCGESGENSNKWYTEAIGLLENAGIGYALWTQKKISVRNNPLHIKRPAGYVELMDYWAGNGTKPGVEQSKKTLNELLENIKTQNCVFNKDVIDAMHRQVRDTSLVPFAVNEAPGEVLACNYDMGHHGLAYFDKLSDRTMLPNGKRTTPNSGGAYRNDGVDIVQKNNDFVVTDTETGEWMNYSIYAASAGIFDVSATVKFNENGAYFSIITQDELKITCKTKNKQNEFTTVPVGLVRMNKGKNCFKIFVEKGGVDFKSVQFQKSSRLALKTSK
jgi:aryl-phospho-beta-D-glucosidase BglC (GH1 family)